MEINPTSVFKIGVSYGKKNKIPIGSRYFFTSESKCSERDRKGERGSDGGNEGLREECRARERGREGGREGW